MIHISKDNKKMGSSVWSISLPPITTCAPKIPCASSCYANRMYRRLKLLRAAWDDNLRELRSGRKQYFESIRLKLRDSQYARPRLFRWHVGGDIPDAYYWDEMRKIALIFEDVKFLVFTKKYRIVGNDNCVIPDNLSVVLSAWPGLKIVNPLKFPLAFMQDGSEDRISNAVECYGSCETCGMCWNLQSLGKNVVFYKH